MEPFFSSIEPLFYFLVINSVYSALLAFSILIIKLLFPKIPRTFEYGLWCLVLIRLILPVDFSITYSLGYLSHQWLETGIPAVIENSGWLMELVKQPIIPDSSLSFNWFNLLVFMWVSFSSIVGYKYILLKMKLSKLLATAHPVEDAWLAKEINYWRREFNITRQIIVIDSDDFLSPFTFAIFLPVIFIPKQLLMEKDNKIIAPIIAHELAHIKRHDALWLIFQNIVQIIYCLNPILWIVVRRLNSIREEICDQKVLDSGYIANDEYGKSLLHVLRLNIGQRSPELFATFFISHKSVFKKRIAAIGSNKALKPKLTLQYAAVSVFAVFFLPMSWQKVIEEPIIILPNVSSPFPEHIRKSYQAPVLLKENKENKISEEVDINLK